MYWNRFDIVEAYYLYFTDYHDGQFSPEYRRLSKMLEYFTPGRLFRWESLNENAKSIYSNLVLKHQKV